MSKFFLLHIYIWKTDIFLSVIYDYRDMI